MALLSRPSRQQSGAGPRIMVVLPLLLVLCLGGWRLNTMLQTQATPQPPSGLDETLTGLVEPIAGMGNIRISISENLAGHKTALVVLNALSKDAVAQIETVKRIVLTGANIDLEAGDTVVIEQVPFASSMSGGLSTDNMIELGIFVALFGIMAMAAVKNRDSETVSVPQAEASFRARSQGLDIEAVASKTAPSAPRQTSKLAKTINEDPAAAAEVLRGWMRGAA